ncbi:MAG: hypothetical protein ACXAEI_13860 [Candidatus Hodarchaeales archaeon]
MTTSKMLEFLNKQLDQEILMKKTADKTLSLIQNRLIHTLISIIALDSQKHLLLLKTAIALFSGDDFSIADEERKIVNEALEGHIIVEADGIAELETLNFENMDDKKLAWMLQYILSEERRHHFLLTQMGKAITGETSQKDEHLREIFWRFTRLAELAVKHTYQEEKAAE